MYNRTYGWVQNPSDFKKLKLVVQIFDNTSCHYQNLKNNLIKEYIPFEDLRNSLLKKFNNEIEIFSYMELVGTSKDKTGNTAKKRGDAVADGIIQVTIEPQSSATKGKMWTDNWTSDGYLRWALSLNFVEHDRNTDFCKITPLGLEFSRSKNDSIEEKNILIKALLAYPPASQVLSVLEEAGKPVTKFYIGDRLGFKGEKGFTSYGEKNMKEWFCSVSNTEQQKIKSDTEGTSDKYARMIVSWLAKLGLVKKQSTKIDTDIGTKSGFPEYTITGPGIYELRKSCGNSSSKKIQKYITWEFLATDGANRDYIRTRRAYILKFLKETKSLDTLCQRLSEKGFNDSKTIIINDIKGLNMIGIRIIINGNKVELKDDLYDFSIPNIAVNKELKDIALIEKKEKVMSNTNIPPKYYELIEIAYNGNRNRDMEILTMDLFTSIYGFSGKLLGGGRRPDGVIYTNDYGVIIDTKAYSEGYAKNINQEDEMVRYIEDNQQRSVLRNDVQWWKCFEADIPDDEFYFMWVSSEFTDSFSQQLVDTSNRTATFGAALNVEQLLYGADNIYNGRMNLSDFKKKIVNKEIIW